MIQLQSLKVVVKCSEDKKIIQIGEHEIPLDKHSSLTYMEQAELFVEKTLKFHSVGFDSTTLFVYHKPVEVIELFTFDELTTSSKENAIKDYRYKYPFYDSRIKNDFKEFCYRLGLDISEIEYSLDKSNHYASFSGSFLKVSYGYAWLLMDTDSIETYEYDFYDDIVELTELLTNLPDDYEVSDIMHVSDDEDGSNFKRIIKILSYYLLDLLAGEKDYQVLEETIVDEFNSSYSDFLFDLNGFIVRD